MHRRNFVKSMAAAGTVAAIGRRAHAVAKGWREFEIVYRISVKEAGAPMRLWVPVPQDALTTSGWSISAGTRRSPAMFCGSRLRERQSSQ